MATNADLINSVANQFSPPTPQGSPDDAARAFELERASGAPAEAINQDIPGFEEFHKAQLAQQIVGDNPHIADFINSHPLHGQLVSDDLGALDTYSRSLSRLNGRHAFQAGVEEFAKGFGGDAIGSEYPSWLKDADKHPLITSALAPLGIPAELVGRGVRGFLQGAHSAIRTLGQDYGMSEQASQKLANDLAGMLEYGLQKPEAKFFTPKGKTIFEYPAEGEVLPPEGKPSGGLPKPPETIEGEITPEAQAAQKIQGELQVIRPFLEAGEKPPVGVSELADKIREEESKASHDLTAEVFDAKGKTALAERSPEKFNEFTASLPKGFTRIQMEAFDKLGEAALKPENLGWIEDLQNKLALRPSSITVPTNDFIARTPKEVYKEIEDFVAHGDDLTPSEIEESKQPKPEPERIKEAAIQLNDGQILTGSSHADIIKDLEKTHGQFYDDLVDKLSPVDGFVTSSGRFVDRVEANKIAGLADQIKQAEPVTVGRLSTEDLKPEEKALQTIREAGGLNPKPPEVPPNQPPDEPPPSDPEGARIFGKAKAFGRTERELTAYEKLIAQRDAEDVAWRLARAKKQAERENSSAFKAEAKKIESEVRDEMALRPEVQAYRFFQDGEAFGNKLKRRPKINISELTDEQSSVFPAKFTTTRGGYTPDAVANLYGYSSGDELVSAMAALEREAAAGRGDIVERLTKAEVDRRVSEKLGEDPKDRLDEAYDHALSVTQMEQLHEQMLRLGTQVGAAIPISPMATKLGALNLLHQEVFGGASSAGFLRESGKSARRVEKALLANDPIEAFKNAQANYISAEMAKEMRQVEKETRVFNRLVKRYAKREPSGVDPEYTNWIHDILLKLDRGTRLRPDLDNEIANADNKTFRDFLNSKAAMGREIYTPEFLLDPTFAKPIEDMSVLQARQAMAAIRSLHKNSRDELRLEREGQKRDKKAILDDMVEALESLGPAKVVEHQPGAYNQFRAKLRTYLALTLQVESLLNRWDRGNAFGVFNQWVGRPLIEAANSEAALQKEISRDYLALPGHLHKEDLAKSIPNTLFREPQDAWQGEGKYDFSNAAPIPLTRKHLRAILLNAGNPSNLKKLADGYQIKPELILDWLHDNAKKEDWDWAQAHGDMFQKLKDMSDKMYRNLSGVAPESIPLESIQTKFGTYKGWYHPLIYDPIWRGEREKPSAPKDLFESEFTRANTPASYTKARTNYTAPLDLSLDQVPSRLIQEIHDISFHKEVLQASKILYEPRFLNAVTKHAGRTYSDLFIPWLKDIANAKNYDSANQAATDKMASYLRQNIIGTFVGLNPRTLEKHTLTALFNSIKEVGGSDFLDAASSLLSDSSRGESNWSFAMKNSEELQRRHQNFMEQVSGAQETALEGRSLRQAMLRFGTSPVAFFDLLSAMPTWLAEYKRTLEDRPHGDAVYAADRAVRRAHGSTAITSRPEIMRIWPGIASLYNFMNRMAQYQYELGWKARDIYKGQAEANKGQWSKDVLLGAFVNVLLVGLVDVLVSDVTDKDSYASIVGKSIATGVAAPWWIARDMMHAVLHKSDPMLGLGSTEAKVLTDALRDIDRKDWGMSKDRAGKTIKHVNNVLGLMFGLTNAEVGNLAEYIVDLNTGKTRPKTLGDWWRGLSKGEIHQREPHPDLVERGLRVIEGGK
jgi:conjugative element/phage-associated large polyvalent protein